MKEESEREWKKMPEAVGRAEGKLETLKMWTGEEISVRIF